MTAVLRHARIGKITPRWPARSDSKARFQLLIPRHRNAAAAARPLRHHNPNDRRRSAYAAGDRLPFLSFGRRRDVCAGAPLSRTLRRDHRKRAPTQRQHLLAKVLALSRAALAAVLHPQTPACMRLLLGPDVPRDIQTMDSEFNIRLGRVAAARLHENFLMPKIGDPRRGLHQRSRNHRRVLAYVVRASCDGERCALRREHARRDRLSAYLYPRSLAAARELTRASQSYSRRPASTLLLSGSSR